MSQPGFIFARDSHVTEPAELRRLSGQCQRILARLQQGPCNRRELQDFALNPTARLSDLRAAGYTITADEKPGGLTVYRLV